MSFDKKRWNKENKEKVQGYRDKWQKNNPEKYKETQKKYYERTKKQQKERVLKWNKENREKVRIIQNRNYHKNLKHSREWKFKLCIRAKTRYKYGKALVCSICNSTECVEHHHYTEHYEVDKFVDLCKICHKNITDEDLK